VRRAQQPTLPLSPVPRAGNDAGEDVSAAEIGPIFPPDHPAWQRDVLAVSQRVRTLLATLTPVVVTVLTFWDHALRGLSIGMRRVEVDASGCYRVRARE